MNKQSGSAIFIILIAVALFAALGFAFMQGSRTSTSMMTDEAAKAYAGQIIAYGNDVSTSVKRLMLRGCKDTQISFENPTYKFFSGNTMFPGSAGYGYNPNAPADGRCHVFRSTGAGLMPKIFTEASLPNSSIMQGHPSFSLVQVLDVKTSAPELAMWLGFVAPEVCNKISQMIETGEEAPIDSNNAWALYQGGYGSTYSTYGEESSLLKGRNTFCARQLSGASAQRIFIHVLIPR